MRRRSGGLVCSDLSFIFVLNPEGEMLPIARIYRGLSNPGKRAKVVKVNDIL